MCPRAFAGPQIVAWSNGSGTTALPAFLEMAQALLCRCVFRYSQRCSRQHLCVPGSVGCGLGAPARKASSRIPHFPEIRGALGRTLRCGPSYDARPP
jgi:hypothetical protein